MGALTLEDADRLNEQLRAEREKRDQLSPEAGQPPSLEEADALNEKLRQARLSQEQSGPVTDSDGRVYVRHKASGRIGTVAPEDVTRLGDEHELATDAAVQRQIDREENESALGYAKTLGEGAAQGLTLGGYGLAAGQFDPEYAARMQQRAEDNPVTSGTGNALGMAAPVLLSGGSGLLARGAAATPAALAARAAAATTEATAARFGGGVLSGIASTALGGAVEGGITAGVQRLAQEVPEFAVDPSTAAEHVLASAGEGVLYGGLIGGSLAAAGAGVKVGKKAIDAALDFAGEKAGSIGGDGFAREMAGRNAYKAIVGRTSKQAIRAADRYGGDAAVGNTALREGIPVAGSSDQILQAASAKADEIGAKLGAKIDELDAMGGTPIKGTEIMDAIDRDVLVPLRQNIWGQNIADDVERQVAPFREVMQANGDKLSFGQVRQMRIDLDSTLAKWGQAGPPSPTTQALRDVRGSLEDSFLEAAENRAKSVGIEGFADDVRDLKTRYSHMRLAADQAQEAVYAQQGNRWYSPSDYGTALGTAANIGMGPVGMAAGGVAGLANHYARQRGRGIAALAFDQLASLTEQKAALVTATNAGQSRVAQAAQALVSGVQKARYAVGEAVDAASKAKTSAIGAGAHALSDADFAHAIAESQELQDPNSDTSQQLVQNARIMDMVNPGMGMAYAQGAHARAALINSTIPKPPSNAMFAPSASIDPISERKMRRTVSAAMDPQAALDRIAKGQESREDIMTVRTIYPALYKSFQAEAKKSLSTLKKPPSYETRLRVGYATGLPTDPAFTPGALTRMQRVAQQPDQAEQEENQATAKKRAESGADHVHLTNAVDPDKHYAPRVDAIMDRN